MGRVASAKLQPTRPMARTMRQRSMSSGTKTKVMPQTGLKASKPQTAPPAYCRPRATSAQPSSRIAKEIA